MTDPTFDELASAHLDGETDPAEVARIAADPALQARVEELRAVRAAVKEVPAADPARRDAAVAAALAAFSAEDAPTALAPRRGPSPAAVRVLGAAAAIALLALLVPLLARLTDSEDQQASFESTGAAIGDSPGAAEDDAAESGDTSTTGARTSADLGTFDDLDDLLAAVSSDESLRDAEYAPGAGSTATDGLATCTPPALEPSAEGPSAPVRASRAEVAGDPVVVVVRGDAGGTLAVLVYRAEDCTVLARRSL